MLKFKTGVRVAYYGRDASNVPTVKVTLEYPLEDGKHASFTQKVMHRTEYAQVEAEAISLLRRGSVEEIRPMQSANNSFR